MITGEQIDLTGTSAYQKWTEAQGIPIIRDFYIQNLREVELAPWDWKGARGVYLNLKGTGDVNDGYICEIAPGKSVKPQRLLFEEMIYIVSGHGSTTVWNDENKKISFEWQAGSLFSPPLNCWRQHFNGSGVEPARFMA